MDFVRKLDLTKVRYINKQVLFFVAVILFSAVYVFINAGTHATQSDKEELVSQLRESNFEFTITNKLEDFNFELLEVRETQVLSETFESEEEVVEEVVVDSPYQEHYSEENLELLAKIIASEYRSQDREDIDAKAIIGIVVLNRVLDDNFPNTVKEVIFQKNQFQPTFDGTWQKIEPTEFDYEVAELVFQGYELEGDLNDSLYFMNPDISSPKSVSWFRDNLQFVGSIKEHEFYK